MDREAFVQPDAPTPYVVKAKDCCPEHDSAYCNAPRIQSGQAAREATTQVRSCISRSPGEDDLVWRR
jgi:hypothetical protein